MPDDDNGPQQRNQRGPRARGYSVPIQSTGGNYGSPRARFDADMRQLDADLDGVPELDPDVDVVRPRKRADCETGQRPCPYVGCRHHLAIDVTEAGSLDVLSHLDLETLPQTCSLDVADAGDNTLEQVGLMLNLSKERVRQIEVRALDKYRAFARLEGVREDAFPFVPDRNQPPEL